jgi:hypothetical protein
MKKVVKPAQQRPMVQYRRSTYDLSIGRYVSVSAIWRGAGLAGAIAG